MKLRANGDGLKAIKKPWQQEVASVTLMVKMGTRAQRKMNEVFLWQAILLLRKKRRFKLAKKRIKSVT